MKTTYWLGFGIALAGAGVLVWRWSQGSGSGADPGTGSTQPEGGDGGGSIFDAGADWFGERWDDTKEAVFGGGHEGQARADRVERERRRLNRHAEEGQRRARDLAADTLAGIGGAANDALDLLFGEG